MPVAICAAAAAAPGASGPVQHSLAPMCTLAVLTIMVEGSGMLAWGFTDLVWAKARLGPSAEAPASRPKTRPSDRRE